MGLDGWVMLRGLAREARHWGDLPAMLAAETGLPVLTPDLPGAGTEHSRQVPGTVPLIVDDLRARLPARPGRWGLFGMSLGGMVTLGWAGRYPEDFAHVVVCNTSARNLGWPHERFHPRAVRMLLGALGARDAVARERRILGLVANTAGALDNAPAFASFQADRPMTRRAVVRQLTAATRFRVPTTLGTPATVLCSSGDRMVSPALSERLAARLGAPLRVHPTGGHDLALDDPAWIVAQLADLSANA